MDDGIADLLHRVVATFGDLARRRMAAGDALLTYTQVRIIGTLEESPGMTQRQLSDSVGLSEAATSRALRTLRDEGFVDIIIDPSHAKRRLASATPAGLDAFHASGTASASQLREWLIREGFPYDRYLADSQRLAELLGSLNQAPQSAPAANTPAAPEA